MGLGGNERSEDLAQLAKKEAEIYFTGPEPWVPSSSEHNESIL